MRVQHVSVSLPQHRAGDTAAHVRTQEHKLKSHICDCKGRRAKEGLLDVAILDAVNEELLPLVGWIPRALIKGVSEEEHGIQHHPAGPHIYWPALICFLLPHIGQYFRSCIAKVTALMVLPLHFGLP